jgi:hypothetical protein
VQKMAFAKLPNVPGPHHRPFGRLLAMEQTNQDIPHDVDDCDVLDVLSSLLYSHVLSG